MFTKNSKDVSFEELPIEDATPNGEVKGITDKVTQYTYSSLNYPHLLITDMEVINKKYMLSVLKGMLEVGNRRDKIYTVYLKNTQGTVGEIGRLSPDQIKMFITLVGMDNIVAYIDEQTQYEGKFLYALSS